MPTYDAPPTLEDLFREAARNHELERVYRAERNAARTKRREAARERRTQIAQAFLGDKSQRALVHPPPSPKRCTLVTDQGRILFDVATDEGAARDVPAEAHRRFRADLSAKKEKNLRERAAQLALHEEKKRFVADWIEKHGTPDQKERQAAGMLPMQEAIEAITEAAFASLVGFAPYRRDGAALLQNRIRDISDDPNAVVRPADLIVKSSEANMLTAYQWNLLKQLRDHVPGSTATLRRHALAARHAPLVQPLVVHSAVLTVSLGPLSLRREYLAQPSDFVSAETSAGGSAGGQAAANPSD